MASGNMTAPHPAARRPAKTTRFAFPSLELEVVSGVRFGTDTSSNDSFRVVLEHSRSSKARHLLTHSQNTQRRISTEPSDAERGRQRSCRSLKPRTSPPRRTRTGRCPCPPRRPRCRPRCPRSSPATSRPRPTVSASRSLLLSRVIEFPETPIWTIDGSQTCTLEHASPVSFFRTRSMSCSPDTSLTHSQKPTQLSKGRCRPCGILGVVLLEAVHHLAHEVRA